MESYIPSSVVLNQLKYAAKRQRKIDTELTQTQALNFIAKALGFNNWSLLHRYVESLSSVETNRFLEKMHGSSIANLLPYNQDEVIQEITDYAYQHYSPLVEFAYHDRESENGYAWPDIDLSDELQGVFSDKYPWELIHKVATDLEIENGPWGIELTEDEIDPMYR